jgi:hypothetical protein
MDQEFLGVVVRESVSLFVLLLVLIGGYRLLSRLIDVFDTHQRKVEDLIQNAIDILEAFTANSHN